MYYLEEIPPLKGYDFTFLIDHEIYIPLIQILQQEK
jgi:hypothetical protein